LRATPRFNEEVISSCVLLPDFVTWQPEELPKPTENRMAAEVTERTAQRAGVWEADGPDGYVTLVVRSSSGRVLLRIEIASDAYSLSWVRWLEKWLHRWDAGFLRVVR
jgi:hypothetical protein